MNIIDKERSKLSIACDNFSILQDKDGITVARIVSGEKSYVVRCFFSVTFLLKCLRP